VTLQALPGILDPGQDSYHDTSTGPELGTPMWDLANTDRRGRLPQPLNSDRARGGWVGGGEAGASILGLCAPRSARRMARKPSWACRWPTPSARATVLPGTPSRQARPRLTWRHPPDGSTQLVTPRVVDGRRHAAFALGASLRLGRLTWLNAAGQVIASTTALPRFGYTQFQP
jgi:hypothetical protein